MRSVRGKAFILVAAIIALGCTGHGQSIAAYAVQSGHWTKAEEEAYQGCNLRYAKSFADPRQWCEVWEEHNHWMSAHPQFAGKKDLSDHPKPANSYHLKTGQRE